MPGYRQLDPNATGGVSAAAKRSDTWLWTVTLSRGRVVEITVPNSAILTLAYRAATNKTRRATEGGMTAKVKR